MSDRNVLFVVLAGMAFATMVWILGYQFYYWAYFDPQYAYLPEGSDQVVNAIAGAMNGAQTLIAAIVTAIVTWKVASKSHEAGKDAGLAVPTGSQVTPEATKGVIDGHQEDHS